MHPTGLIGATWYYMSLLVAPATAAVWMACIGVHVASVPSLFGWQREAQKEDEEALEAVRQEIKDLEEECKLLAEARAGVRVAAMAPTEEKGSERRGTERER